MIRYEYEHYDKKVIIFTHPKVLSIVLSKIINGITTIFLQDVFSVDVEKVNEEFFVSIIFSEEDNIDWTLTNREGNTILQLAILYNDKRLIDYLYDLSV